MERFAPDLLWNDIDWPDAGKHPGPDSFVQLLTEHLAAVPDGLVNDRWGVPAHGVLTREYQDIDAVQDEPFEATRGLGLSFGYNADESAAHALDGAALIRLLVDVVSKNGNLLINVGPRADGSVPPLQSAALEQLGEWLAVHGDALYGTRPWFHEAVRARGSCSIRARRRARSPCSPSLCGPESSAPEPRTWALSACPGADGLRRRPQASRSRTPVHSDSAAPTKPSTITRRWIPSSPSRFCSSSPIPTETTREASIAVHTHQGIWGSWPSSHAHFEPKETSETRIHSGCNVATIGSAGHRDSTA